MKLDSWGRRAAAAWLALWALSQTGLVGLSQAEEQAATGPTQSDAADNAQEEQAATKPPEEKHSEPDRPVYRLSLAESERLALQYSRALAAARSGRDVAEGQILSAWSEALPSISGSFSRKLSDTYAEKRAGIDERDRWNELYTGEVRATQPLYKGGRIGAGLRAARLFRDRVEQSVRGARQQLLYGVRTLYYQILLQEEIVRVAREQVELADSFLEDVRQRERMEVATEFDVLRAEVEKTNQQTQLTQAENELANARSSLLRLLGLPLSSRVELTGELEFSEAPNLDEGELYHRAQELRPELRAARLTVAIQRENVRATRAELYPHLSLSGAYSGTSDDWNRHPEDWEKNWSLTLQLDLQLFDGLLVRGQIREAEARRRQLELEAADRLDEVRLDVRRALLDIASAEMAVRGQERNVAQARESLRLTRERERQGVSTYLDVLDARQTLAVAERNYYRSIYDHRIAWTDLALAVGTLGERPVAPSVAREETPGPRQEDEAQVVPEEGADAQPPAPMPVYR